MSPARKMPFRRKAGRGDPSTANLRYEFFRAVDDVAPHLAGEMVQVVGPTLRQLAERLTEGDLHWFAWIARDQEEFMTAWWGWAQPYGFHLDSWILDHVLCLLPAFLRNPDIAPIFSGAPVLAAYPVPGRQITPPGPYRPDRETLADYQKRVSEYANLVADVAHVTGWEPSRAKPNTTRHLRWLARFQVLGETVEAIAHAEEPEPLDRRSVERALKEMADLIGLTRRNRTLS